MAPPVGGVDQSEISRLGSEFSVKLNLVGELCSFCPPEKEGDVLILTYFTRFAYVFVTFCSLLQLCALLVSLIDNCGAVLSGDVERRMDSDGNLNHMCIDCIIPITSSSFSFFSAYSFRLKFKCISIFEVSSREIRRKLGISTDGQTRN